MTIALARIDNRLVHGQILSTWVPALKADALVVLDDEAARNTLVKSAMEIAIPPDVAFVVQPVAKAKEALAAVGKAERTIVLLRDVADAVRAVGAGLALSRLNVGNVHFSHGRQAVTQAVYLSADEIEKLAALAGRGIEIELRTLPRDAGLPLSELRRRVEAGASA